VPSGKRVCVCVCMKRGGGVVVYLCLLLLVSHKSRKLHPVLTVRGGQVLLVDVEVRADPLLHLLDVGIPREGDVVAKRCERGIVEVAISTAVSLQSPHSQVLLATFFHKEPFTDT
jgi:hypothetical protein